MIYYNVLHPQSNSRIFSPAFQQRNGKILQLLNEIKTLAKKCWKLSQGII